jgi:hypothetical protein
MFSFVESLRPLGEFGGVCWKVFAGPPEKRKNFSLCAGLLESKNPIFFFLPFSLTHVFPVISEKSLCTTQENSLKCAKRLVRMATPFHNDVEAL